ncbi:MAG: hypothetical protein KBA66_06270 [Leptospiraceae bacterium]|nr:hypothetical protein [Leptospiraceae bacterium]
MKQKYFLLLVMNLLLVRCVVFNNYNPKPNEILFTEDGKSSKSILVNVKQKHFQNGDSRDVYPRQEKKLRKKFAKILAESYLFKEVKTGLAVSDIQLRIEIDVKVVMDDLLFMLSCLTFQIVPLFISENHTVTFQFRDKKNTLIKEYKKQVKKDIYIQLFLLPVLPVYFLESDPYELITKSVLLEANQDGILK